MKTKIIFEITLLLLAILFIPQRAAAQVYTPPDSCLKMICPNDYDFNTNTGSYNPDSVRVDSCEGSPTFGKIFAKRYFILQFKSYYYPFDKILKPDTIKEISDISTNHNELKLTFQNLESVFGKIYFQGLINDYPDSTVLENPRLRLYFQNNQDCDYIINQLKEQIDSIINIIYTMRAGIPMNTKDYNKNFEKILVITTSLDNDFLLLKNISNEKLENIKIYNVTGNILIEKKIEEINNIANFSNGLYFLIYKNKCYSFIKYK